MVACSDAVVKGASIMHGKDKTLYIDTHAKKSATKLEEMHFAKTLAKAMGAFTILALGSVAYDAVMGSNTTVEFFKQSKPSQDVMTRLFLVPTILLNANRFTNIARHRWNLVDQPPTQQERPRAQVYTPAA